MLQNHLPILSVIISSEDDSINLATRIAIVKVAQELLANLALALHTQTRSVLQWLDPSIQTFFLFVTRICPIGISVAIQNNLKL